MLNIQDANPEDIYDQKSLTPETLIKEWMYITTKRTIYTPFMQLQEQSTDYVKVETIMKPQDAKAAIVGRGDSSILIDGEAREISHLNTFDIIEAKQYKLDSKQLIDTGIHGNQFKITKEAVVNALKQLEFRRATRQWEAVSSMINRKEFKYKREDVNVNISYSHLINDLTTATGKNFQFDLEKACLEYKRANEGRAPTHAFVNLKTAQKIRLKSEVITELQSMKSPYINDVINPDFVIGKLPFIIDTDSEEEVAIPDDVIILVGNSDETQDKPFIIYRCALDQCVGSNSKAITATPYFKAFIAGQDPFAVNIMSHENMLPGLLRKNVVMHWRIV